MSEYDIIDGKVISREKPKCSEKNQRQFHFFNYK
jgi:hypothetical protein